MDLASFSIAMSRPFQLGPRTLGKLTRSAVAIVAALAIVGSSAGGCNCAPSARAADCCPAEDGATTLRADACSSGCSVTQGRVAAGEVPKAPDGASVSALPVIDTGSIGGFSAGRAALLPASAPFLPVSPHLVLRI